MTGKNPIVHFEIPADDVERAKKFYETLFGWEIIQFDMPADGSTQGDPYFIIRTAETDKDGMIKKPGAINGGMMKRKSAGQPFMNYIHVASVEEKLKAVEKNGGTVCMPRTEIGKGMGWIAAFKDTEGNLIGLHEMGEKR